MKSTTDPSNAPLRELLSAAKISWWKIDFTSRIIYFSDFMRDLLHLPSHELTVEQFSGMIHKNFRDHLFTKCASIKVNETLDERFPIQLSSGEQWLRVTLSHKEYNPTTGLPILTGIIQLIPTYAKTDVEILTLMSNYQDTLAENKHAEELLNRMPVGYFRLKLLYDQQGQAVDYLFLNINQKASQIIGRDLQPLIGKTAHDVDDAILYHVDYLSHIPAGGHYHMEWTAPISKCSCRNYVYNTPDDPSEIVILLFDITETTKANSTLADREKLLQNVFLHTPAGISLHDTSGKLIKVNAKWIEMFGCTHSQELIGVNLFDDPNIPESAKRELRHGREADFTMTYNFAYTNNFFKSTRNDTMDCSVRIRFLYNHQGKPSNILIICIDDTQFNIKSNRVAQFEDMFHHISSFARVGYATYDLNTKQGFAQGVWNENYGEAINTPIDQIVGVYSHLHPDDQQRMQHALEQFKRGEISSLDETLRVIHADGSTSWTRTTLICTKTTNATEARNMIGISYDITELITARQRAEEANRLKSAFLANMSHEIRTPLNAIVGFSEMLMDETENEQERQEYIQIIRRNNTLLLQIVSDILILSTLEAGMRLTIEPDVDLIELCQQIANTFTPQLPEEVRILTTTNLSECHLTTTRKGIVQILSNFVSNAIKFTNKGEISLQLQAHEDQIEITVSDTGIGISPDFIPHIFERFAKGNTFAQGTGLGLAICKELAEQMGGHVEVKSTLGRGSSFMLYLPKK
ncbi:MAG: PAS domain-containing sensor histidine kinase [Alistipes sp.]